MKFYLAKTLDNIKMFGPIPDLLLEPVDRVEEYSLEQDENDWIIDNIVCDINYHCGTNLDNGDYDFFNVEQCKSLFEYLDNLPEGFVPNKYNAMICKLKEYSQRAIDYNTGIAIDL